MRKIILISFVIALSICATACFNGEIAEVNETAASGSNATSTPPADKISEGALVYMDPKIDMFLMVDSVDWVYTKELYEGQVFFHPKNENPMATYNGFSISSQEAGNSTIEQLWDNVKSGFEASIPGFEWNQEDNIEVGSYTGYRYHFSGDEFTGDYIFWETEAKLYICSLTSFPNDYEDNAELLIRSLKSFKTLG